MYQRQNFRAASLQHPGQADRSEPAALAEHSHSSRNPSLPKCHEVPKCSEHIGIGAFSLEYFYLKSDSVLCIIFCFGHIKHFQPLEKCRNLFPISLHLKAGRNICSLKENPIFFMKSQCEGFFPFAKPMWWNPAEMRYCVCLETRKGAKLRKRIWISAWWFRHFLHPLLTSKPWILFILFFGLLWLCPDSLIADSSKEQFRVKTAFFCCHW